MARVLFSDPHVTLTFDEAHRLVRYTRSPEPYASLDALRDVHERIARALDPLPASGLRFLVDLVEGPARNDESFEAEIQRWLRVIVPRFPTRAVLVKSAVGRLQVSRMGRGSPGSFAIFAAEAEALAHLGIPAKLG